MCDGLLLIIVVLSAVVAYVVHTEPILAAVVFGIELGVALIWLHDNREHYG